MIGASLVSGSCGHYRIDCRGLQDGWEIRIDHSIFGVPGRDIHQFFFGYLASDNRGDPGACCSKPDKGPI